MIDIRIPFLYRRMFILLRTLLLGILILSLISCDNREYADKKNINIDARGEILASGRGKP